MSVGHQCFYPMKLKTNKKALKIVSSLLPDTSHPPLPNFSHSAHKLYIARWTFKARRKKMINLANRESNRLQNKHKVTNLKIAYAGN
jgi:hypothetical protein